MPESEVRIIATLSKLDIRCEKCKHKDICNDKRMVSCALVEAPIKTREHVKVNTLEPMTATMTNEYTPITINMSEYGNINTSLEQIAEQINKAFQINCAFNKSYF